MPCGQGLDPASEPFFARGASIERSARRAITIRGAPLESPAAHTPRAPCKRRAIRARQARISEPGLPAESRPLRNRPGIWPSISSPESPRILRRAPHPWAAQWLRMKSLTTEKDLQTAGENRPRCVPIHPAQPKPFSLRSGCPAQGPTPSRSANTPVRRNKGWVRRARCLVAFGRVSIASVHV